MDTQGLMVVQKARGVFKEFFPETSTKTELPEFFFATRQKTFPGTIYGGMDPRPTRFMVNTGWHCWTSSLPASWPQRDGTSGGRRAPREIGVVVPRITGRWSQSACLCPGLEALAVHHLQLFTNGRTWGNFVVLDTHMLAEVSPGGLPRGSGRPITWGACC